MKQTKSESISAFMSKPKFGSIDYFPELLEHFYQSSDWRKARTGIKEIPLHDGVCAKVLTEEDVAWFCKTCGKDNNCIQCQECFEASDHKGHQVYLERYVSGCCDCGDPEAWEIAGCCPAHQGFIEESKASIDLLPLKMCISVPLVIEEMTNRYFSLLYAFYLDKNLPSEKAQKYTQEIAELIKIGRAHV